MKECAGPTATVAASLTASFKLAEHTAESLLLRVAALRLMISAYNEPVGAGRVRGYLVDARRSGPILSMVYEGSATCLMRKESWGRRSNHPPRSRDGDDPGLVKWGSLPSRSGTALPRPTPPPQVKPSKLLVDIKKEVRPSIAASRHQRTRPPPLYPIDDLNREAACRLNAATAPYYLNAVAG